MKQVGGSTNDAKKKRLHNYLFAPILVPLCPINHILVSAIVRDPPLVQHVVVHICSVDLQFKQESPIFVVTRVFRNAHHPAVNQIRDILFCPFGDLFFLCILGFDLRAIIAKHSNVEPNHLIVEYRGDGNRVAVVTLDDLAFAELGNKRFARLPRASFEAFLQRDIIFSSAITHFHGMLLF